MPNTQLNFETNMEKRLTRMGKSIIAEVYRKKTLRDGTVQEILVDSKEFNGWAGSLLYKEPTQKTYDEAHKWADNLIFLHFANTNLTTKNR